MAAALATFSVPLISAWTAERRAGRHHQGLTQRLPSPSWFASVAGMSVRNGAFLLCGPEVKVTEGSDRRRPPLAVVSLQVSLSAHFLWGLLRSLPGNSAGDRNPALRERGKDSG